MILMQAENADRVLPPSTGSFRWALVALVCIAAMASLWMHGFLNVAVIHKSWQNSDPGSRPDSSSSSHPRPLNISLSDVLFPVPATPGINPWIHENSEMLHSLVSCIEHGNCRENQTKGS